LPDVPLELRSVAGLDGVWSAVLDAPVRSRELWLCDPELVVLPLVVSEGFCPSVLELGFWLDELEEALTVRSVLDDLCPALAELLP